MFCLVNIQPLFFLVGFVSQREEIDGDKEDEYTKCCAVIVTVPEHPKKIQICGLIQNLYKIY